MQSQTSVLTAVASRSNTKAIAFVEKNKCPQTKAYGNYEALLADSEVEALYIIALAYVLSQPFEAFALIGPRFISETANSFESLKIQLTPSELKWLNLEQNVRPR